MDNKKISVIDAVKSLKCGRSTFYQHLKKQGFKSFKKGNRAFITLDEYRLLKKSLLAGSVHKKHTSGHRRQTMDSQNIEDTYTKRLESELKDNKEKIEQLTLQVGQWMGRAKTLEEQNQKILLIQSPIIETNKPIGFKERWRQFWND